MHDMVVVGTTPYTHIGTSNIDASVTNRAFFFYLDNPFS